MGRISLNLAPPNSYVASTVHGLEWVAAAEIEPLTSTTSPDLARRKVSFRSDRRPSELLGLRASDDLFVLLATIDGLGRRSDDLADLAANTYRLDWLAAKELLLGARDLPSSLSFDVVASIEGKRAYNRFDVEAAVGRVVERMVGWSFLERTSLGRSEGHSSITVRLFLERDRAMMALRLGAMPLHRRAYKTATQKGTVHPPVAAAMTMLVEPHPDAVLDPFCGDGTIAIETKLHHPTVEVLAGDLDDGRVANTKTNALNAGVDLCVDNHDAADLRPADLPAIGAIVTNPPWRRSVFGSGGLESSFDAFWDGVERLLPNDGVLCVIGDEELAVPEQLRNRGWQLGIIQRIRLAGRIATIVTSRPEGERPTLPGHLAHWRKRATVAGVTTQTGF